MQDVTIAAIQMTAVAGDIEGNLTSIDRLLGDAIGQGADIVRFTELSVCGYNTQLVISPDGIEGKYRKSHVHTTEISTRRHGDGLPIFDHPKIRFGVEICYGTHFPEISTALADKGAERIFLSHGALGTVCPPRGCTTTRCSLQFATRWVTTKQATSF